MLRLFGVYGPGQEGRLVPKLVEAVRSGAPVILHRNPHSAHDVDGLKISPTYIDDLVGIIARICAVGGPPVMNVAGSEVLSIREIANRIGSRIERAANLTVADTIRHGDLVADNSLLVRTLAPDFTEFECGVRHVSKPVGLPACEHTPTSRSRNDGGCWLFAGNALVLHDWMMTRRYSNEP